MGLYGLIVRGIDTLQRRADFISLKTHTFYGRSLNADSVVIDLGANVGNFATAIIKTKGVTCHALEAVPDVFARSLLASDFTSTTLPYQIRTGH